MFLVLLTRHLTTSSSGSAVTQPLYDHCHRLGLLGWGRFVALFLQALSLPAVKADGPARGPFLELKSLRCQAV